MEPQGKIKGTKTQKGASGSEPTPLGLSHVHMQTCPSFQPTQQQPPEGLAVATPLISLVLLPHHLPTVPEKSCVLCWSELSLLGSLCVWAPPCLPQCQGWDLSLSAADIQPQAPGTGPWAVVLLFQCSAV